MGYRQILTDSLDEIFAVKHSAKFVKDALESKLFGLGSESFVVGSHEFYFGYALSRKKMICYDLGHYHPTESVADKISSTLLFFPELLLHISRPVRWDSDHVVILNDDVRYLFEELVRSKRLTDIHVGLDFFDGTINRIGAYAVGGRAAQKGLMLALLQPHKKLVEYERKGDYFARMALMEACKTMPFGAVWDKFCVQAGVPVEQELISVVHDYENKVLKKRK
jgi:L-rhamnose isomerase